MAAASEVVAGSIRLRPKRAYDKQSSRFAINIDAEDFGHGLTFNVHVLANARFGPIANIGCAGLLPTCPGPICSSQGQGSERAIPSEISPDFP